MLFVVEWKFRPEFRDAANNRFKETGGPPPEGIEMIGRWHYAAGRQGLLVCKTDDAVALGKWTQNWTDHLDFRIHPVNDDEGVMEVLTA
jgi:hypothetical protein